MLDVDVLRQAIRKFGSQHPENIVRASKGERIIVQGELSADCFLITEGVFRVLVANDDNAEKEIALRHEDDLVGEIAFLQRNKPRTASVEVMTDQATLIKISRHDVISMQREYPGLMLLMEQLVTPRTEEISQVLGEEIEVVNAWMSVMLVDIHGFTPLSEKIWEEHSNSFLSEFLEKSEEITERHYGDFEDQGDGFKAHFRDVEHAVRCLKSAIDIQSTFWQIRDKWASLNEQFNRIGMGIGITTDIMLVRRNLNTIKQSVRVFSHSINVAAAMSRYRSKATDIDIYVDTNTAYLLPSELFNIEPAQPRWLEKLEQFYKIHRVYTPISQKNLSQQSNPYVAGPPISDEKKFFGRQGEVSRILSGIVNNHYLISGERRIGKTSLLRHLEYRLRKITAGSQDYYLWPVFVTLQGITPGTFYNKLMSALLRQAGLNHENLSLKYPLPDYDDLDFEEDIRVIIDKLSANISSRQIRLILCLDELDVLANFPIAYREQLRGVVQSLEPMVRLIGAGIIVAEEESLRTSPFYNQFTHIHLSSLSFEEAERLIRQPAADVFEFTEAAVDRILRESHGLPLTVQRLCYHSVDVMMEQTVDKIDVDQVNIAFERALDDHIPEFQLLWWGRQTNTSTLPAIFNTQQQRYLLEILEYQNGVIPADAYEGSSPLFTRRELDNLTYDSSEGLRLTKIFTTWLRRNILRHTKQAY
jgi:class 3 adenylate cyclase